MFPLRSASMRILRGRFAVRFDALLYLGVRNGEHTIYEMRESVVLCIHA